MSGDIASNSGAVSGRCATFRGQLSNDERECRDYQSGAEAGLSGSDGAAVGQARRVTVAVFEAASAMVTSLDGLSRFMDGAAGGLGEADAVAAAAWRREVVREYLGVCWGSGSAVAYAV